jgi:hypothetical protein
MALQKKDREFRLPKISYLDFKYIEMDRVLTGLFERLEHNGYPSVFRDKRELTVEKFVDDILEAGDRFQGFTQHRDIVTRWVETHLMDIVNRGTKKAAVAGPRPLHGYTYRFRNPKHSRDYGAAQQLYQMLHHARHLSGHRAIEHLKSFFFDGFDKVTRELNDTALADIETATLLHFLSQRKDTADTRAGGDRFAPVCIGAADLDGGGYPAPVVLQAVHAAFGDGRLPQAVALFSPGALPFSLAQVAAGLAAFAERRSVVCRSRLPDEATKRARASRRLPISAGPIRRPDRHRRFSASYFG